MPLVRVFLACSLDGFLAGPADELDWLPMEGVEDTFTPFLATIGALAMGRRTYDVVSAMPGPWPYGERPMVIATSRPLDVTRPGVEACGGSVAEVIARARARASAGDVYLDGGALVRAALDAALVDELTLTMVPIVLGAGRPLFAGAARRTHLAFVSARPIGAGLVQLRYRRAG